MNEENAESAEIILGKAFGSFDLPGRVGKGPLFLLHPGLGLFPVLISACSASSAVKSYSSGGLSMTGVMGISAGRDRITRGGETVSLSVPLRGKILNYLDVVDGGEVPVFCLTDGALIH
jgi:hypothetical protein